MSGSGGQGCQVSSVNIVRRRGSPRSILLGDLLVGPAVQMALLGHNQTHVGCSTRCTEHTHWAEFQPPLDQVGTRFLSRRYIKQDNPFTDDKADVCERQNILKAWSVYGYSELMFRHILCQDHYPHRPDIITARLLTTGWQCHMTSMQQGLIVITKGIVSLVNI